jgi:hypothetical protein
LFHEAGLGSSSQAAALIWPGAAATVITTYASTAMVRRKFRIRLIQRGPLVSGRSDEMRRLTSHGPISDTLLSRVTHRPLKFLPSQSSHTPLTVTLRTFLFMFDTCALNLAALPRKSVRSKRTRDQFDGTPPPEDPAGRAETAPLLRLKRLRSDALDLSVMQRPVKFLPSHNSHDPLSILTLCARLLSRATAAL